MKITLEAARVNAGYKQKEVAEILQISNKTLSNWENGVSTPTVVQAENLCNLYKMPLDSINFLPKNPL